MSATNGKNTGLKVFDDYQGVVLNCGPSLSNVRGGCRVMERIAMSLEIPANRHLTLIFKPIYACNLACVYCYNEGWRDTRDDRMSLDEARRAFSWVSDFCLMRGTKSIKVIWHGGEPLLMGGSFFRDTIEYYQDLFARAGIDVKNVIQTNITLVNDEYVKIFRNYFNSSIGFSFDYKSECRCFPNGKDASDLILEKAQWTKAQGIRAGAIMVCCKQNVGKIDELFSFMAGKDIPFKFSRPFLPFKPSSQASECIQTVTDAEYVKCVCDLIDIALRQKSPRLAQLCTTAQDYISAFLLDKISSCTQRGTCSMSHLSIGPHGDIYPCGRFTDNKFRIGNYLKDTPGDVMPNLIDLCRKHECRDERCQSCKFIKLCKGGCTFLRATGCHDAECWVNQHIWEYVASKMSKLGLTRGSLSGCIKEDVSEMVHKAMSR